MAIEPSPSIKADDFPASERGQPTAAMVGEYLCPGEVHPISRAVHYARLAAFFPKCRVCEHRRETGSLPRQIVERIDRTLHRVPRESLLSGEGVRGAYLNEIGPREIARFAAAFAVQLWKQRPKRCSLDGADSVREARRAGPAVVLGRDGRPSSPRLVVEAAAALRSMGCRVIDVGIVSAPCVAFAVNHLSAAGGILVTGSGCGPSMNGLDFWEAGAIPWSQPGRLQSVEAENLPRPTRQGGDQRSFQAAVPYSASLLKHFHALRPLHIAVGCASGFVREQFEKIFEQLPGHVEFVSASVADDVDRSRALTLERTACVVRDRGMHCGAVIDDDAQACRFLDESGRLMPISAVALQFARIAREESESPVVVLDDCFSADWPGEAAHERCSDSTREAMARHMAATAADLGAASNDRYWIRDDYPVCDAIVTTARILQVLSRSDRPCSDLFLHG